MYVTRKFNNYWGEKYHQLNIWNHDWMWVKLLNANKTGSYSFKLTSKYYRHKSLNLFTILFTHSLYFYVNKWLKKTEKNKAWGLSHWLLFAYQSFKSIVLQIEETANLNLCYVVLRCWRLLWNQTDVYAYFGVIVLQIKLTKRISITFEKYNLLKLQISKNIYFFLLFWQFFENKNFWNWNGNVKFGGCFFEYSFNDVKNIYTI